MSHGPWVYRRATTFQNTTMQFEILTPMEAEKQGYLSLTTPYRQDYEHEMRWFKSVLKDMRRCDAVIIDTGRGYEVARHKSELILAEPR
jgi:polysaccharide pyruvyl transferase WcaK-like protein